MHILRRNYHKTNFCFLGKNWYQSKESKIDVNAAEKKRP